MTPSRLLKLLSLSTALLIPACMDAADATDDVGPADDGTAVHLMPMQGPADKVADAAPAGAHLTFFGGPTLTHVSVHPVFWNANTQFQANLNAFYKGVTNSTLYDMLKQYSSIGRGSGVNGFVDNRTTTSVSDAAIHTELNRLFTAGSLPLPSASNYYPVHFPSGVTITAPDGSRSCQVFCAYHGTYVRNGVNVNYGVVPDQGGGCAGGCGRQRPARQQPRLGGLARADRGDHRSRGRPGDHVRGAARRGTTGPTERSATSATASRAPRSAATA